MPGQRAVRVGVGVASVVVALVAASCSPSDGGSGGPTTSAGPTNIPTEAAGGLSPVGTYTFRGRTPTGSRYRGRLEVGQADGGFDLHWHSGGSEYEGVGIQAGNLLATSFGDEDADCDIVLYRVGDEGDLAGIWASPGDGTGSERALRRDPTSPPSTGPLNTLPGPSGSRGSHGSSSSTATTTSTTSTTTTPPSGTGNTTTSIPADGVSGSFVITGVSPDGNDYTGLLDIAPAASAFSVSRQVGGILVTGSAIRKKDALAAGLSASNGQDCAVEIFTIRGDGTLHGRWGAAGAQRLGTEVATRD